MKQQQQPTAKISFDFTFRPITTPRKTIRLEEHLKNFRILNFVNNNVSICKIYIENDDVLKPFLNQLPINNLYNVYAQDNDEPFATILIFQKNNVLNYTVKSTILNIENIKIEKQNSII